MKSVVCNAVNNMKDSGIKWLGMIPKHWDVVLVKNILRWKSVKGCGEKEVLSLYREYGVIPKSSRDDNHNVTSDNTDDYKLVEKGDFVINKMKAWQGSMGISLYEGIISPAYYVCSFINEKVYKPYFHYLMRNSSYLPEYKRLSGGIRVGQWDLGYDKFKSLPALLPPTLSEQRAIADWLDAKCADIDAAIELQQRMIDKLKAYKTAVIHQAVTKGLDKNAKLKDSGVQWIGEVPEHWGIVNIGSLYNQRNEKVSDKDYKPLSVTKKGILPQLETAAKTDNGDNRKLVRKNDFAINSRSDRKGSCGISDYDGSVSLINIVLYPIQEIENRYYNWLFHSPEFAEEFYRLGHGIVADLWTTRWSEMKGMRILLPPTLTEQRAIADWLDAKCADIDATIALKEQKQEKLKAYKKTIIFEYVTGKKQVANINKQL
ncbi:restriction endonuclease subunit S [Hoylesella nanceiensis]|uniref:Restriction endonuclease subunit S n=1 Tax=Hoylesella nanceiensis TaxID=425941 RepID=A0ABS6YBJ2_9BACT|nr:restriction endonuclease subunit S [Hoylesella nanceiensis]MBW4768950.1 restriction endonuclease subunit S [Hoylesella nanceiensis]